MKCLNCLSQANGFNSINKLSGSLFQCTVLKKLKFSLISSKLTVILRDNSFTTSNEIAAVELTFLVDDAR